MKYSTPLLNRISDIIGASKFTLAPNDFDFTINLSATDTQLIFDIPLDQQAMKLIKSAIKELKFTVAQVERFERILKAICALEKVECASCAHVAEALAYTPRLN